MTFSEFQAKFPDELSVIKHFIGIRYPQGVTCSHCGSDHVYHRHDKPKVFVCHGCGNSFSIFEGTIFEHSSTDMRKWMFAIHLFLNGKKGISGLQLQREIGVTYKCAWRMLQQIRTAMGNAKTENHEFFDTIVEIDECYLGCKPRQIGRAHV